MWGERKGEETGGRELERKGEMGREKKEEGEKEGKGGGVEWGWR